MDPTRPVRIRIPRSLMIPVAGTQLRDGELVMRPGAARKRESAFFEAYQREFGWSAGGRDASFAHQADWHAMPKEIVDLLKVICAVDDIGRRFDAPTDESALQDYIRSRAFFFDGRTQFIPVVELVNHDPATSGYAVSDSIDIGGSFAGEVVVNYNKLYDAISIALSWGFACEPILANSLGSHLGFENGLEFRIARSFTQNREAGDRVYPKAQISRRRAELAFLTLGNQVSPETPRAVFREVMRQRLNDDEADPIFNTIIEFNKQQLSSLLALLRGHDAPIARMLADATVHQMNVISASV